MKESDFARTIIPIILIVLLTFVLVNWKIEPYVYPDYSNRYPKLSISTPNIIDRVSNIAITIEARNAGSRDTKIVSLILKDEHGNATHIIHAQDSNQLQVNSTLSTDPMNQQYCFDLKTQDNLLLQLILEKNELNKIGQTATITLITSDGGAFVSPSFTLKT